ncbi:hypothetical protein D3C84_557520 [compost metagenome]
MFLARAADLQRLDQIDIGQSLIVRAQPSYQARAGPGMGLLVFCAPGAFAVVFQQRLIGLRVAGVNDAPALQGRVQALLKDTAIEADESAALVLELPGAVGLQLFGQHNVTGIGNKLGTPQALRTCGAANRFETFHQGAVEQFWHHLAGHVQPADQCQVQPDRLQMAQRQLTITDAPGLVTLIHLVEQLTDHHRRHQRADTGDEQTGHHQRIQTKALVQCLTPFARLLVGIGGRHRELTGLGFQPGDMVLVEEAEQLTFDGDRLQVQRRVTVGIKVLSHTAEERLLLIARDVGQKALAEVRLPQVIAQMVMQCGQVRELAQRNPVAR